MAKIESGIFEPNPNDRIRILLEHNDEWKALFWIKVAKDGSIYLAPRIINPKMIKSGKTMSSEKGIININYSEGVELKDNNHPNKAKISFHASGIINSINDRNTRKSLRNIQEQEHLCSVFFQHPDRFDIIPNEKFEKRDICLRYPIEEDSPLFMHIFVAPTLKFQLINMDTEKHQVNVVLQYKNIEAVGDLTVQLSLFSPSNGPWPPYTYVIYQTNQ